MVGVGYYRQRRTAGGREQLPDFKLPRYDLGLPLMKLKLRTTAIQIRPSCDGDHFSKYWFNHKNPLQILAKGVNTNHLEKSFLFITYYTKFQEIRLDTCKHSWYMNSKDGLHRLHNWFRDSKNSTMITKNHIMMNNKSKSINRLKLLLTLISICPSTVEWRGDQFSLKVVNT